MDHYHPCDSDDCRHAFKELPDHIRNWYEHRRQEYERTRNPVYAWNEWRQCRTDGTPIPEWVVSYFDRCAEAVHQIERKEFLKTAIGCSVLRELGQSSDSMPGKVPRDVVEGFDFESSRGKPSPFTSAARETSNTVIMFYVVVHIGLGKKLSDAYLEAAQRFSVDARTIERIYTQHDQSTYFTDQIRAGMK